MSGANRGERAIRPRPSVFDVRRKDEPERPRSDAAESQDEPDLTYDAWPRQ